MVVARALLVACVIVAVFAQPPEENAPAAEEPIAVEEVPAEDAGFAGIDEAIMGVVQGEEMLARTYLELVLKVQAAYYNRKAASSMVQLFLTRNGEEPEAVQKAIQQAAPQQQSFEESDADEDEDIAREDDDEVDAEEAYQNAADFVLEEDNDDDAMSFLEIPHSDKKKQRLIAQAHLYLDLFTAIKVRTFQSVYAAADLQKEFFLNRGLQLKVGSLGDAIPKEYANLLYIQLFKTYLSTQKLSKSFQMVSTWSTWLEDELDKIRGDLGDHGSGGSNGEEIYTDRLFAFQAYSQLAYLELSEFMVDTYLEYQTGMVGAASAEGAPEGAASFLETGASSKTKFVPTMLAFSGQSYYAMKLYKMYYLYYQYAAAQAGLQAASIRFSSLSGKGVGASIPQGKAYAKSLYALGFGSNLMYASDVEMVTSMWAIYNIVAPMFTQQENNAKAALHM
jgi:hypothetical protein